MKEILNFRWDALTFFETLIQLFFSILAGYPKSSINDLRFSDKGFIRRLRQDLVDEDFEDEHPLITLVSNLEEDFEAFREIDIRMGESLLHKLQISSTELFQLYDSGIHLGIIEEIFEKGAKFPEWLEDPRYQEFLLQINPIIEKLLGTAETIEYQIKYWSKEEQQNAVLLSAEWEWLQKRRFLLLIMQKGVEKALPEIRQIKQTETNPLGWMKSGFNQYISDKIDEAMSNEPEDAIPILKSIFQLKPKAMQACSVYYDLAICYENLERWEEAIEAYSKMNQVAPPSSVALFYQAKCLHRLGRDDEARKDIEEALSLPLLHIYVLNEKEKKEAQELLLELTSTE